MSNIVNLQSVISRLNIADPFDHVETGKITALGGDLKLSVKTESHYALYIRRPMIVVHYMAIASPLGYRRYTALNNQQDRVVVSVSSGGKLHTNGPVDAAAWSGRADDNQYPGWLIRPSSNITFDFQHLYIGVNSMNVPIDVEVILSGYRLDERG